MPIKYNMSLDNSGYDSDGSISWEDFFGKTTAEDLVPTLLEVYDSLVGNTEGKVVQMGLNVDGGREGESVASKFAPAKQLNPATVHHPPVTRPLSISSIASLSSSSSSSGSGSGDSGVAQSSSRVPKFWDPQLTYMDRIVLEILETERYYVTDLQQVIIGYLEFWRSSDECPLTNQQLDELFCNMKDIYHFNSSFLRALEDCGLNPVEVARCFVRNNEGFSIYTSYCTNYPRTVSLLTELMRRESMSRLFRERQIALQHTLPLGSYLLKPVQRILKYHLFLQNIVKHFSLEKDGFKDIANALSTMTAIAEHINCMKRRHEHAVRVQEIQSLLLGWQGEDLTTYGELCAEGAFRVFGAKGLRHAFLFDQMLLITKKKEEGLLAYKTHIMCSNLMLIESVPGEPQSFHVIPFDNPRLQYTLQARSLEQKRDWTLQIKRVILENYNAVIPTHARQLVMQLGQNRSDDELLAEKSTPKRQHSAPEYLERRKQERNRRKSEITVQSRFKPRMKKSGTTGSVKTPPKIGSNSFSCTREDSNLQSPADLMERLGPKRRQSEPGYYSGTSDMTSVNSSTMELSITEVKEDSKKRTIEDMIRQVLYQNSLLFRRKISRNLGMSEDEEEDLSMKFKRKNFIKRAESFNGSESSRDLDFTDSVSTHSTFDRNSPHNFSFHDVPTSPAVWLKQQRQHLASPPSKKSGSLPRSFQISPSELENRIRPITIASDKPQNIELSNRYNNENLRYCHSPALSHSDNSSNEYFISATSSNQLNVHPEYRIYREGVSKAIVKQIMSRFSSKLALLKSSSETLNSVNENKFRISQILAKPLKPMDKGMTHVVTYKQGSSSLGARIAHADYADPKELYPSIKPSEKTEALLGLNNNKYESEESEKSESLDKNFLSNCQRDKESRLDCESNESADSYYERFFESIESEVECEVFRDSAVFSDQDDAPELSSEFSCHESESETDSKPVCHKSNSISATESVEPLCHEFVPMNNHKNVNNCKVPPPVPTKPKFSPLRSQYVKNMQEVNNLNESIFYNARVSSISRGWVRHVVGKLQAIDHQSVQ